MPASRGNMEAKRALALAGLIRQGRRAKHWTQRDLAQAVPIGQTSISRYERANQGVPPDETIIQIARALDADPRDYLRAAGRLSGETFETAVLDELLSLRRQLEQIDRANAATHAVLARNEQATAATRDVLARIEAALQPPSPSR